MLVPELEPKPLPTEPGPKDTPPIVRAVAVMLVEADVRVSPSKPPPKVAKGAYRRKNKLYNIVSTPLFPLATDMIRTR